MVQISSLPYRLRLVVLSGLLGLLLVAWGSPRVASAQTPMTTIQNGNNDTRLQLNYDGGFYVPGTFGPTTPADSIPATGAGTRMMWYPAKGAFRAGRVGAYTGGTRWDAANVGDYSIAFGADTKADAFAATAMGRNTIASGQHATAMGFGTTASNSAATAMGYETTANDFAAIAMGFGTTANGFAATSMGEQTTASGRAATAMGYSTFANAFSTSMGEQTTASGRAATAMGFKTAASSFATTAMGYETTAGTEYSLSIGVNNLANTSADESLFVVGNGQVGSPSDALVLDESGNLEISGVLTEASDRRLKTNIEPLDGGVLQKIGTLRPVRYRFKDPSTHPSGERIGLIAQEVRDVFPALVSEGAGGTLSVSYSKMTAVVVKALQEQHAQIETQQATIDSLRTQARAVAALRAQNEAMNERLAALDTKISADAAVPAPLGGMLVPRLPALLLTLVGIGIGLLWRRRS